MTQKIINLGKGYPEVLLFLSPYSPKEKDLSTVTIRCWSLKGDCMQIVLNFHYALALHYIKTFDENAAYDFYQICLDQLKDLKQA